MAEVKIYTTTYCCYCSQAKSLLNRLTIPYEEISVDNNHELRRKLSNENNGYRTVPMIFIGDKFIGGYTDLAELHRSGSLEAMVKSN